MYNKNDRLFESYKNNNKIRRFSVEALIWKKIMKLTDFAGNNSIKEELAHAFDTDTLPHAIIIEGEKGTGKRTLANIIAQYCVCRKNNGRPCGVCDGCQKAARQSHPDILVADGSTPAAINVEAIRKLRASAFILPNEAPKKVYILANCDRMNPAAQNAFLKILEEPPKQVVFILTCNSSSSLLLTVRSRSRILSLLPPDGETAINAVLSADSSLNPQAVRQAAEQSGGNIGRMTELLQSGGTEVMRLAEEIALAIPDTREYPLLVLTNRLVSDKAFAISVTECLFEIFCEAAKASVGIPARSRTVQTLARKFTRTRLLNLAETAMTAKRKIQQNANMNLFSTWLCVALRKK